MANNTQKNEPENQNEQQSPDLPENIWEVLRERKKRGLWDGEIEEIVPKEYNLTQGEHYYEIDDLRQRTVKCSACPITHGGILEAHLLTRYEVKNGIIYLDGKPKTKAKKNN